MEVEEQKKYWQVYTDCWQFLKTHIPYARNRTWYQVAQSIEKIYSERGNSIFVNDMVDASIRELQEVTTRDIRNCDNAVYKKIFTDAWLYFKRHCDWKLGDYEAFEKLNHESQEFVDQAPEGTDALARRVMLATDDEIERISIGSPWKEKASEMVIA